MFKIVLFFQYRELGDSFYGNIFCDGLCKKEYIPKRKR